LLNELLYLIYNLHVFMEIILHELMIKMHKFAFFHFVKFLGLLIKEVLHMLIYIPIHIDLNLILLMIK